MFVLFDMFGCSYKYEFGMFTRIAWREWFAFHACHLMWLGMRVMYNFVNTGDRNIIAGFEFLRHRKTSLYGGLTIKIIYDYGVVQIQHNISCYKKSNSMIKAAKNI